MDFQNPFNPIGGVFLNAEPLDMKLEHDRYEVYVNGDFVGIKTLLTQNEEVTDLNDFLREQGIKAFQAKTNGDHYEIHTDKMEEPIKDALQVYLQTR
ncbi:hypothetical protein PU629_01470 [Pullulanibacillus sp. KACC 23026]|uniref:hypothetical protein n=1 Tax=Pullulanibacillus sp. KACC 23026 TaxID=3028315 RepID=UPI0023AEE255|nr:hypothetical protein [Pullulanibacillus sp. KACC 23026]WEG13054.1 hypothetical protein PU629_01470 [Pullulanibacillus sp. KACC 23026]